MEGLGYKDSSSGIRGDLYVVISKVIGANIINIPVQKMMVVYNDDFEVVNSYLDAGWKVKEFRPFKSGDNVNVYILLENT